MSTTLPTSPTHPPGPPMTPAEFRVVRERLGLTTKWLAEFFGVQHRNVQVWDRGDRPQGVPTARATTLRELERAARQQVDELGAQLRRRRRDGRPLLRTYRTDAEYQEHDGGPYSASWHRALVGRAAEAYDGPVTILYITDEEPTSDQDVPVMTGAEFHVLRDRLGLTNAWVAEFFGVQIFAVQRWERGDRPILEDRAAAMRELDRSTRLQVEEQVGQTRTLAKKGHPTVQTYVTDEQYQEHDGGPYSASWHRALVGRAAAAYGGPVTIRYATDVEQ